MHSFQSCLFIGFPVDSLFQQKLDLLPETFKSLFIQDNEAYLQKIQIDANWYLGKIVQKSSELPLDLPLFEQISSHIYTVLKKIIPDYPYDQKELVLLPLTLNETQKKRGD